MIHPIYQIRKELSENVKSLEKSVKSYEAGHIPIGLHKLHIKNLSKAIFHDEQTIKTIEKSMIKLSISKFERIVKENGYFNSKHKEEMERFANLCPLCEVFYDTASDELRKCAICPFRPKISKYTMLSTNGCVQTGSLYMNWVNSTKDKHKETAREILKRLNEILKSY